MNYFQTLLSTLLLAFGTQYLWCTCSLDVENWHSEDMLKIRAVRYHEIASATQGVFQISQCLQNWITLNTRRFGYGSLHSFRLKQRSLAFSIFISFVSNLYIDLLILCLIFKYFSIPLFMISTKLTFSQISMKTSFLRINHI